MISCDLCTCLYFYGIFYFFFLHIFFSLSVTVPLFLHRSTAKRDTMASVVSPASPSKKQLSPAGAKSASAFGRDNFREKMANSSRATTFENRVNSMYRFYILNNHLTLVHNLLQFTSRLFSIIGVGGCS
jgi:hypothetical protein